MHRARHIVHAAGACMYWFLIKWCNIYQMIACCFRNRSILKCLPIFFIFFFSFFFTSLRQSPQTKSWGLTYSRHEWPLMTTRYFGLFFNTHINNRNVRLSSCSTDYCCYKREWLLIYRKNLLMGNSDKLSYD